MVVTLCVINTGLFAESPDTTRYDKRIHHYRKNWESLIPTQLILQTCGNMGLFSVGVGWDYGKRGQWETQLLFGYIPKYSSHSAKMTITLKENYIPWAINLKKGWNFEPLECGLYFNTVIGQDFWTKQPTKYQSGYYPFSTRIRPNIFIGERFSKEIPKNRRKFIKSFTFFYELGTNDIYFMRLYRNGGILGCLRIVAWSQSPVVLIILFLSDDTEFIFILFPDRPLRWRNRK